MQSAALRRVKTLLRARSGSPLAIHALGGLEAILGIGLIMVAGLLLGLFESRGVTFIPYDQLARIESAGHSAWIRDRLPMSAAGGPGAGQAVRPDLKLPNTGLYPLVVTSQLSPNPLRRVGATVLGTLVNRFRPIQTDFGALQSLLIFGLLLLLGISYLGRYRRVLAAASTSRATRSLRNQIHRQMYRLGHSALPNEGSGPVLNLFSRDVNEVRDGLIANLETTFRVPLLAVGLLVIAVFLSPILSVFLLSLGGIVWFLSIPLARAGRSRPTPRRGSRRCTCSCCTRTSR